MPAAMPSLYGDVWRSLDIGIEELEEGTRRVVWTEGTDADAWVDGRLNAALAADNTLLGRLTIS